MAERRGRTYGWISLTTDYGLTDGFAAACQGQIARLAPGVRIIDVSHLVPPGNVAWGAAVLAQTVGYLPTGVHVGVVDPGVGTGRRGLVIETPDGLLVGPDNGLLLAAATTLGGVVRAVTPTNPAWLPGAVTPTFHGRDVFAPVAARLATGASLAEAGPEIDPTTLVRLPDPVLRVADGLIEAEVVMVDRFGNVQLAAPGSALTGLGDQLLVGSEPAARVTTFGEATPGRLVAFVDSAGKVALAVTGGQAAALLAVGIGDIVRVTRGDAGPNAGPEVGLDAPAT